jgi:hypothetical protein
MNLGIVVGTCGTPAFIHLHLEISKRLYPEKILVVDDDSSESETIKNLCEEYNANFLPKTGLKTSFDGAILKVCINCKKEKLTINNICEDCNRHFLGDISLTASGLRWAKNNNVSLLVKFSRRFIPLYDWRQELLRIAYSTNYPAYTSWDEDSKFGFKTEAVAYTVNDWIKYGAVDIMEDCKPALAESFMWANCLRLFDIKKINEQKFSFDKFGSIDPYWHLIKNYQLGYGQWFIAGTARSQRLNWRLWHHTNTPADYLALANSLGINNYREESFIV